MRSTLINSAGKTIKWSYSATTNGKWFPVTGNPNADRVALTLVSDREIKSQTRLHGKASAKSTASISADGKQLTVNRSMLIAKGAPTDDTLVYDRAE
jgi:hypothetical protein